MCDLIKKIITEKLKQNIRPAFALSVEILRCGGNIQEADNDVLAGKYMKGRTLNYDYYGLSDDDLQQLSIITKADSVSE